MMVWWVVIGEVPGGGQGCMHPGEVDEGQEVQCGCWLLGQACWLYMAAASITKSSKVACQAGPVPT